ncbi:MAG: hypothetical protein E4H21_08560 [Thermodesulfobacteriales bacterium]|nr:MAG: hypothetical protein E4H21_08560 [Thermodesulfobacteriales bacterium]
MSTKPSANYIETLKRFRRKAAELRESKLIKENFSVGFTMTWKASGLQVSVKEPDDTSLRAYLTTFRQFIMQKERINIDKVYTILQEHLKDEKLKGYLAKSQVYWQNACKKASFGMIYNKKHISPQEITDLFLYGDIFHGDQEKEVALNALFPHERNLFKCQFLEFVLRATEQILYVDRIIGKALDDDLFC